MCTSKGCGEGNFFPKVVFFWAKMCTSKGYGGERETLKSGGWKEDPVLKRITRLVNIQGFR